MKKESIKADFVLFGEAAQDEETKSVIAQFVNLLNRGRSSLEYWTFDCS